MRGEGPPLLPLTPVLGGSMSSSCSGRWGGGGGLPGGAFHDKKIIKSDEMKLKFEGKIRKILT